MSAAFTSPVEALTWQELLDEITLAYSERRQAIGQASYTPEKGRDVQAVEYWTTLQEWLENNCAQFINHIAGPLTGDATEFLFFDLETWRDAAGLDEDGFRRSVDGVNFSYGTMQKGDIIGPWIFEDLQKGFGALRWSAKTTDVASSNSGRSSPPSGTGLYGYTCDDGRQRIIDNYTDWIYDSTTYQNRVFAIIFTGFSYYQFYAFRNKYRPAINGLPEITRIAELYFKLRKPAPYNPYGPPEFYSFDNWDDLDYGRTFSIVESFGESSSAALECSNVIGDGYEDNPVLNVSCPLVTGVYSWGCESEDKWLLKWNFTNA